MAINFPNNPSVDDTHSANDITWKWDGTTWKVGISTINAATIPGISTTGTSYFYNVSVASSVTAATFYGDGSGLVGIAATNADYASVAGIATNAQGLTGTPDITVNDITCRHISSSGIVTANAYYGDGSNLTGVGGGAGQGGTAGTGSWTATAGVLYELDNISINNLVSEYILYFDHSGSNTTQAQKVLVLNNGINSYIQEYGVVYDNNLLVSVGSSISQNNLTINAVPETGINGLIAFKFLRNDVS